MSARGLGAQLDQGMRTGQVLAEKYLLEGRLGKGGMGEVYAAQHTLVGRRFAIKFLHAELTRDADMMRRFRREAKSAGSLSHENIVAVTDFGHAEDGAPFIVMEYLEGEDLGAVLRRGPLSIGRAADLIVQACRGLHAAHAEQIVHRDLKPENLFIVKRSDGSDLVKVLDFGIAKLRGEPTSGVSTKVGAIIGTLPYMPVEQLRGDKETDQRADVYALGAILYQALTCTLPHPGKEVQAVMYHILYEEPRRLESARPDASHALAEVVHKALAREAGDRFQSAAAFGEALLPFADAKDVAMHTTPLPVVIPAASPPEVERGAESLELEPRWLRLMIVAACVLAFGVAALFWTLWRQPSASVHPPAIESHTQSPPEAPAHAKTVPREAPEPEPPARSPAATDATRDPVEARPESEQGNNSPTPGTQTSAGHRPHREVSTMHEAAAPDAKTHAVTLDRANPY